MEVRAEVLLATRRILARLKLELLESGEDLAHELTEEDRQMLAHDTQWRAEDDLRVFAEWHGALGTDRARKNTRPNTHRRLSIMRL